jgi:hypothetical protein
MHTALGSQQSDAVVQWLPAAEQPLLVDVHTGVEASFDVSQ